MATNRIVIDTERRVSPNLVLMKSVAPQNRVTTPSLVREIPARAAVLGTATEGSMVPLTGTPENPSEARAAVLNSWKEIASFLNRGVRTVQRWERELQLPVHRIGKGNRSPVFAYTSEVKLWLYANRSKLAAEEQVFEKGSAEKVVQTPTETRMKAWVRCRQLTEELTRLMQQHQLQTLRLAQNLENTSCRWAEISGTRAPLNNHNACSRANDFPTAS